MKVREYIQSLSNNQLWILVEEASGLDGKITGVSNEALIRAIATEFIENSGSAIRLVSHEAYRELAYRGAALTKEKS